MQRLLMLTLAALALAAAPHAQADGAAGHRPDDAGQEDRTYSSDAQGAIFSGPPDPGNGCRPYCR